MSTIAAIMNGAVHQSDLSWALPLVGWECTW